MQVRRSLGTILLHAIRKERLHGNTQNERNLESFIRAGSVSAALNLVDPAFSSSGHIG